MENQRLVDAFTGLSTPLVSDACLRLNVELRIAPPGIHPLWPSQRVAGRALPVRHYGSVDIFLEVMGLGEAGDVLVIDNGGRVAEGCIGDLTVLEARASGLSAIVVWGVHRDTAELQQIGFPVFSFGPYPAGPRRLDPPEAEALVSARFGAALVTRQDVVFGDADGLLFVPLPRAEEVISTAHGIWQTERQQADAVQAGRKLREQLQFDEYLARRAVDRDYTFRRHLGKIGGAIEE